ncbi:MAG: polyphenol oxidase family protein [Deltaproteobacteria bacterium]|jgi:YfiH family protein|nr:polyphenol oxidase family protein [Deltaproteobacteria bacterium]
MEKHLYKGLGYYTFDILAPYKSLRHGVFTRSGPPELGGELTFSFRPDIPNSQVLNSLKMAEEALGLGRSVFVMQTHSANIYVQEPTDPYSPRSPEDLIYGYDALVTKPGRTLLIKLADCQGILLFHPPSEVIALVHSGWRGSKQNILGQTAAFLKEKMDIKPEELLAAVSPSLGPCCAEFINYKTEMPEEFWPYLNPANNHFDFWSITQKQLTGAGLRPHNIELAKICTKCQPEFYSYRRGESGRFAFLAGVV